MPSEFPRTKLVGSTLSEKNPYRDLRDSALKRPCRGAALESDSLTAGSSSRLFQTSCLHQRRGALFLIKFLSKLASLGVLPALGPEYSISFRSFSLMALLRPLSEEA